MAALTVIGIDPGSQRTGWGVVREVSGVLSLVECGVVRAAAGRGEAAPATSGDSGFSRRLARIYHALGEVLARHRPDQAAMEQVFTARNAASALKLGQARGAAVAACAAAGLDVCDYAPTLVKKSLVGTGRAEKEQVAFMVRRLLNVRAEVAAGWPLDASDALAVAICHLGMRRLAALQRP
ncbi:crossover junction endodeoxyribonuclease RuvC [uncultured Desulfovibrio sp.]|uniref:crossover junction endodeoxyribonuclease RuvC n=1 Tax=uncultured Desulfovibrio sp. TaxID=167968 RepID=UPI0025FDB1E2|nr:crossover junction endodeoxyribonuclease RuvC [uncultured Desulfovibrio sp.]